MAAAAERISDIRLDDRLIKRRSPEIEHEMGVAIYDLLETNRFVPAGIPPGPYHVLLAIRDGRTLVFEIMDEKDTALTEVAVPLSAFRRIVKDYFTVCESYFEAIPGGVSITLVFHGGGHIRLEADAITGRLVDIGEPTKATRRPRHSPLFDY